MIRVLYIKCTRYWLMGLLFFLPFQHNIIRIINEWNSQLGIYIRHLDELTITILLPLALIELYKNKELLNLNYLAILLPISLLSLVGFISGEVNGNLFYITLLGIFDYIKVFFVVFIYAAFFREISDFNRIFRFLLVVAILVGVIAFIQEIWALSLRYILEMNIENKNLYILRTWFNPSFVNDYWRLGIYRATSLMHHPNWLGMFCLLILTMYLYKTKKVKLTVAAPLLIGIIASVSRTIYIGFMLVAVIRTMIGRKRILIVVAPMVLGLYSMAFLSDFNIVDKLKVPMLKKMENHSDSAISFREYTSDKAMEVFEDHPFWGVGPGKFGGSISIMYNSSVYDEYNFQRIWLFKLSRGIDQFWPKILAETGIIGTVVYLIIFITFAILLGTLKKEVSSNDLKQLFGGLLVFLMVFFTWSFSNGLYLATTFIYFAFIGIGIACANNETVERNSKDTNFSV